MADQRLKGRLQRLSITGGCAVLDKRIKGGTLAEIEIPTPIGSICGLIEFLERRAPGGSAELAFRFIGLDDNDYERLTRALKQFG